MHETVFKDCLRNTGWPIGNTHHRHELRLQICREAGERVSGDIDRAWSVFSDDMDRAVGFDDAGPGITQNRQQRIKIACAYLSATDHPGHRRRNRKRTSLNPV